MAEEKIEQEMDKMPIPTEENTQEASEKSETTVPDEQDIEQVLMILNEVNQISGGKGKIAGIAPEMLGPVKYLIEKITTILGAYEDPLFKDVLDDMNDQRMSGQVPSLLVAVARNVPMEELQKVADDEGYEDVQSAVGDRVSKEKEDAEAEKTLYGNFDKSKKEIEDYCKECGYDDARKQKLYATIAMLRDVFADGLITKKEAAEIDKIINYESDIATLKSQVPAGGKKVVLPDKASIEESMTAKKPTPTPSQSTMANANSETSPWENIGKRRFEQKSRRG
jgi:hypothetical protein